jgi:hypothetical protein
MYQVKKLKKLLFMNINGQYHLRTWPATLIRFQKKLNSVLTSWCRGSPNDEHLMSNCAD